MQELGQGLCTRLPFARSWENRPVPPALETSHPALEFAEIRPSSWKMATSLNPRSASSVYFTHTPAILIGLPCRPARDQPLGLLPEGVIENSPGQASIGRAALRRRAQI